MCMMMTVHLRNIGSVLLQFLFFTTVIQSGRTALHYAAFSGRTNTVTYLLEEGGAKVDATSNVSHNTGHKWLRSYPYMLLPLISQTVRGGDSKGVLKRAARVNARAIFEILAQ